MAQVSSTALIDRPAGTAARQYSTGQPSERNEQPGPDSNAPPHPWRARQVARLLAGDALAVTGALTIGVVVRFGVDPAQTVNGLPYSAMALVIGVAWLLVLATAGAYESRHLGLGAEEYKRIGSGTFQIWAVVALVSYAMKAELARGFVVVALPLGLVLLLTGRGIARHRLLSSRIRGRMLHRVVVVGDRRSAVVLAAELRRVRAAGFDVVGVCLPTSSARPRARRDHPPVLGTLEEVPAVVRQYGVDTVAVASPHISSDAVRRLSWSLEGSGVDLVVAPAVVDVAGPRVSVRPVAGLPLLHVDEPGFTGGRRLAKDLLDRMLAALALLLLVPVLLSVALAVRWSTPGPAVFRQPRTGRGGKEFQVYKFRTMYVDAEQRLCALAGHNESDGLLFKMKDDPRVTPLGRLLRRTSLDELPQLLNVLRGEMSLVGPRPLPVKDAAFTGDARRRLLVRPGITGLWQVSGRSRLSWEDAIRLDLYYVENWSIGLDLAILLRTVSAVVRGTGAY